MAFPIAHLRVPRLIGVLFIVFVIQVNVNATTVVTLVTPKGMVVASDSRYTTWTTRGGNVGKGDEHRKTILVKNRFAISCIGKCGYVVTPPSGSHFRKVAYDFQTWILQIDRAVPDNISFSNFMTALDENIRAMIPDLRAPLKDGAFQRKSPVDMFEAFTTYVIAGYEAGTPRLETLDFYVDWDNKEWLGPYIHILEPSSEFAGRTRMWSFGMQEAISNVRQRDAYAFKRAMTRCPQAFKDFSAYGFVPLDEILTFARCLVGIEAEINPEQVNGPINVVEILPSGKAIDIKERSFNNTANSGKTKQH